jgi:ABC-2 type transport system ATP-binding protein
MKYIQLEPDLKIRDLSKVNRGRLKIVLTLAREVPYVLMDELYLDLIRWCDNLT